MRIIPVYLPQFHQIPENDEWWGKGFTEWTNVKQAKPLYDGHNQPRVPLNQNYYDLSDVETLKWQCNLAKEYGIFGFCMYHYWFNGHLLLQRPMEMLLAHPEIDINYCISWANHDWTDGWKHSEEKIKVLIAHDFNDEKDWVNHFNYLLPFFKDPRYIRENNKPIMVIYIPNIIHKLNKMLDLWTKMAQENGLDGLTYIYQSAASSFDKTWDRSRFTYGVEMNPGYANMYSGRGPRLRFPVLIKYSHELKSLLGIKRNLSFNPRPTEVKRQSYDKVWQDVLRIRPQGEKMIPCAFTDWDNTPRHGIRGSVMDGTNPISFKKYFAQLVRNTKMYYDTDMIFVFAWNEWAEGGYLEPDEKWEYGFLKAIQEVLKEEDKG